MNPSKTGAVGPSKKTIPWWEPSIGPKVKDRVFRVIESGYLNDGEVTAELEKRLMELTGSAHAVGVSSGTAGLFLSLVACGVGPGDEVLVPDVTFIATANAVSLAGATTVLVDVRREDFSIDPEKIAEALTPKTRAILPVHVNGRSADMDAILSIARAHGLKVVEDAAETLGASWKKRSLGTLGDAGALSFASSKLVTTGQGGAVLTNNHKVRDRIKELKDQGRLHTGTGGDDKHPVVGYNFKLTNLQAAVALAQLEEIEERTTHLRNLYEWYRQGLAGIKGLRLLPFDFASGQQPQWIDVMTPRRDQLAEFLLRRGIRTRKFWFPLHTQPPYRDREDRFPNASAVCREGLWLPSSVTLRRQEVARVTEAIREFFLKGS